MGYLVCSGRLDLAWCAEATGKRPLKKSSRSSIATAAPSRMVPEVRAGAAVQVKVSLGPTRLNLVFGGCARAKAR